MSCRNRKRLARLLYLTLALFLASVPAFSQTATGRISGTVKDQTGGSIAGAAVVVTDVARGLARNLTTDEAGAYLAPNLIPGTYSVRATFTGFQAWERTNITLGVGGDLAIDAVLLPGAQTQTVTITEELPLVNTTSSVLGGTFTTDTIMELPVLNRNYMNIMDLRPAVVLTLGNDSGGGGAARTNGLRPDASNNYMIEGLMGLEIYTGQNMINRIENNGDVASIVPNDSIQEFDQQFNSKAEYGNKAGSNVNVGLKSGTNALHGTGYGYFRNAALDSRNYFNPEPDRQNPFRQEQVGATLGGPILRDKLFFFLGYEQQNLRHANLNSTDAPFTDPALIANFPACISTSSCAGVPNAIAGQGTADFENHFILACLEQTSPSAQSLSMLGLNPDCTPGSNYVNPNFFVPHGATDHGADLPSNPRITTYYPNSETTNLVLGSLAKLDYQFNEKSSLNGFYFRGWGDRLSGGAPVRPGYRGHYTHSPQMVAGTWTWLPNSSLANSFRVGYTHLVRFLRSADQELGKSAAELGIPTGVTDPVNAGNPRQIALNGFYNLGGQSSEFQGPASTVEINDSINYLRGQHALRFGGTFLRERIFQGNLQNGKGIFGFGSARSNSIRAFMAGQNAVTGTSLTSGLQSGALLYGKPLVVARRNDYAFFIQDDWRIHPRVTLNLGVRYDYATTLRDDDSFFGRFDPIAGLVQVGAQIPRLYNPDGNNWAPRVGFAWDIRGNGRTVLRGGGSIVYEMLSFRTYLEVGNDLGVGGVPTGWVIGCGGVLQATVPAGALTNCTAGSAATSGPGTLLTSGGTRAVGDIAYSVTLGTLGALQWDGPSTRTIFPQSGILNCSPSVLTVAPTGGGARAGVPCPAASIDPNIRTPYVETWTLSLQHAIISNVVLEAAYVGNHGVKLFGKVDLNQPPPGSGWTPALIALCNANKDRASCADNGSTVSAAYTANINAAKPFATTFPHISVITHMDSYQTSNYNGLQVTLTARNFHGLSVLSGYTWSHALEISGANNSGLPTDSYNPAYDYGQAGGDLRHRFTLAPTYTFPNVQGYAGLLEGWKLSGAFRYQVGRPLSFTYNRSFQGTNRTTSRWDLTGDPGDFQFDPYNIDIPTFLDGGAGGPAMSNSLCTASAASQATLQAFGCWTDGDSVLTPPALGTFGNSGKGMFTGLPFWSLDLSVGKRQRLTERFSLEFRAELYNALNHPAFDNPGTGLQNADSFTIEETPDVGATNPFLGSGGPRRMQVGVKVSF